MCPVCITTAMLIAGSVASTGGLAAVAVKKLGAKSADDDQPTPIQSQEDDHGSQQALMEPWA
jgi:hypothetical protein